MAGNDYYGANGFRILVNVATVGADASSDIVSAAGTLWNGFPVLLLPQQRLLRVVPHIFPLLGEHGKSLYW